MSKEPDHPLIVKNREQDLYFLDPETDRIIYIPQGWCDDFHDDDVEEGNHLYGYIGQTSVTNWAKDPGKEWLTSDACGWTDVMALEKMRQVSSKAGRELDPDLFALLDAIDSGIAV